MLLDYKECVKKYGSDYKMKQALKKGTLFQIEKGIYSDKKYVSDLEVFSLKYPKAIFTMNSAFYYHGLTDVIPDYYYIKTSRGSSKLRDHRVKQAFENYPNINLGKTEIVYNGVKIHVYSKERVFVELIRNRSKIPYDYYKELINNYRKIIDQLDIQAIEEYASMLPKTNLVMEALQAEVM